MIKAAEILNRLSNHLKISIAELANNAGYERPQAFYDVINGKTKNISSTMANRISAAYPELNQVWLLTGEGDMLKNSQKLGDITGSNNTAVAGNGNHVNSETDKFLDLLKTQTEMLQKRDTQIDELIALLKK